MDHQLQPVSGTGGTKSHSYARFTNGAHTLYTLTLSVACGGGVDLEEI